MYLNDLNALYLARLSLRDYTDLNIGRCNNASIRNIGTMKQMNMHHSRTTPCF